MGSISQVTHTSRGEDFDYVLVGGGTSGCLLASLLAESLKECRILLLEAGVDTGSTEFVANSRLFEQKYKEFDYGYATAAQQQLGDRVLSYAQGKGLGGSSAINRLLWTAGSEEDYNCWADAVDDDDWRWTNVQEALKQIVKLDDGMPEGCDSNVMIPRETANGFSGPLDISLPPQLVPEMKSILEIVGKSKAAWNSDTNSGDPIGVGLVWNSYDKKTRTTSYSAFLQNKHYSNLTIRTDSPVSQVILDDRKAVGCELANGTRVFATKEVILSSGTFNTPTLLMRSGLGPENTLQAASISPKVHLPGLGQNLNDHTRVQLLSIVDIPSSATYELLPGFDSSLIGWLKLPKVLSSPEYSALPSKNQAIIAGPKTPTCEFLITVVPNPKDPSTKILSIMVINMNTQARGSVGVSGPSFDDPPVIDPNLLGHPYDRRVMIEGVRQALAWLDDSDLARYRKAKIQAPKSAADADIDEFITNHADVVWHAAGTAAMGRADDPMACVDTDFRLRGVEGLRVADLSVCPFVPNTHTQSTAYVVGWMAARKFIRGVKGRVDGVNGTA